MIWSKGIKFSGFDSSHIGAVIRKFGEDQSKSLPMGLFFLSQNFLVVVTTLYLSKPPHSIKKNHNCVNTGQQNCYRHLQDGTFLVFIGFAFF